MPVLKNPRWEAFAQGRAAGLPAYKAFVQAGFKAEGHTMHANSSRLMRNDKVLARIREIVAESADKNIVTIDTLIAELDQAIVLAHEARQPSAVIAAVQAKAKLAGLDIDRWETKRTFKNNYAAMTEEEVLFEIAAIHQSLRLRKDGKGKAQH